MTNFALIVFCLILGIALRRSGRFPEGAHLTLNAVIVNVALPALTFSTIRRLQFDAGVVLAVAMPWLVFGIGFLFFSTTARVLHLNRATTGGLLLTGALGNTSFVGLPMIETFFGKESMRLGLLIDQLGSYLVLSTIGLLAAASYSGRRAMPWDVVRKIAGFPPLQALVLAILLTDAPVPAWFDAMLARLGDAIPALAMLSVGSQLRLSELRRHRHLVAIGLGFKLVLVPLFVAPLYLWLLPASMHHAAQVTVFESAMAPMIGAGVVAMQYELDSALVSLMLGIGIPLSLMTVPAWWYALMGAR